MRSLSARIATLATLGLIFHGLGPGATPAAAQDIYTQCYRLYNELKSSDVVNGIEIKGHNPVAFTLYVSKNRWTLLDAASKEKVMRIAACYAARGNTATQVSGLVYADGSNTQLGVMSLSGDVATK